MVTTSTIAPPLCLIPKSFHRDPFPNGMILHKGIKAHENMVEASKRASTFSPMVTTV